MKNRVLCLDDETIVLHSLQMLLEDEYEVITVTSPIEALEKFTSYDDITVVISDFRMPTMNGGSFFYMLRERFPHQNCFKIIYSGYADNSDLKNLQDEQIIDLFLYKSTSPQHIKEAVRLGVEHVNSWAPMSTDKSK